MAQETKQAEARQEQGEHDELIARLADLYIDEYAANVGMRAAAYSLDEEESQRDVRRLVDAAHDYRRAYERIEAMKEGVSFDVLYGQLVIGAALQIAEQVRDARREQQVQRLRVVSP